MFVTNGLYLGGLAVPWYARFAGSTAVAPPPTKPPSKCRTGGYCIKARCEVQDVNHKMVGQVVGFDTNGNIAGRVENACKYQKSDIRGQTCTDVEITLLPARNSQPCDGRIYYELAGGVKKML